MRSVDVALHRRPRGIRADDLRRDARRVLERLGIDTELSIALVGDAAIHALNATHRGKDRPTDVLSFGSVEKVGDPIPEILGDVVISVDTAARQAAERGASLAAEVRFLLVHGILHLVGWDHERSPDESRRMFRLQRKLIRELETE